MIERIGSVTTAEAPVSIQAIDPVLVGINETLELFNLRKSNKGLMRMIFIILAFELSSMLCFW